MAPILRCRFRIREQSKKSPYPGIPTTADGAGMVVWVETHITQGACAYPITSSTTMGGGYQAEVANGKRNLWGEELAFIEPESEHSAASTCEGFAVAGGRVTNFTSGQGLILMKEVLLHDFRQASADRVSHRSARSDLAFLECPCRPRRRLRRCRLRLGNSVCPQRAGSRRSGADLPAARPKRPKLRS